jgi:hypothetical protein
MEKLDLLVWSAEALAGADSLDVPGVRSIAVSAAADIEKKTLLMGRGPALAGLVELWVDCVDVWRDVVEQVPCDAYLVTESVPQPVTKPVTPGLLTHLSWFPKPERLTDEEFFHGWHEVHTPTTGQLHPLRQGYVRDAVARRLTPSSPPVRAIVSEFFAVEDYTDPARLFGSPAALQASVDELPLYADYEDVSSCPLMRRG